MTRKRVYKCDNPDCPHEQDKQFNDWIRKYLPDSSTGFMVSDIDFFLYNYKTKRCMMLEVKTHSATVKEWQRRMHSMICSWIDNGIDEDWKFYGYHVITFQNTSTKDGEISFDNDIIDESKLVDILSMKY